MPEPTEKAMRFYTTGNMFYILTVALGFLIPALFLFTGFSAKIRDWSVKTGRKWFFIIACYIAIFTVIEAIIYFPLDYYLGFVRLHDYGLSNQIFGKWFGDSMISLGLSLFLGVLIIWIPYLLFKKSPKRWWLYTGLAFIPLLLFVVLITPVLIDPLYNDFGPMKNKELEAKILDLAETAGIEGSRVFEVNKSVDTEAVNAYVTGFGGTKRIVLWDTIIEKLDEDELLVVMAHEMGHYALNHVMTGILFAIAGTFLVLYLVYRTIWFMIRKFGGRFRFDRLDDIASYPLLMLMISFYSFLGNPLVNAFSRYLERESDRFALEITHDNRAAAEAFVKLQYENLANPRPGIIYTIMRASHPSLGDRIDFCNEYKPWETGEELKYGHLFRR
ncbi:M48 family metallopeptidase [candidate division KSB1 bacterium]